MKKTIILISAFLLFLQVSGFLCGAIPASERAALIALYNATGGDNWEINSGWKAEPLEPDGFGPIGSEDNWHGITVSGDHVIGVHIGHNQLTGSIPSELGNLGDLVLLYLDFNQLTGSIPPELGNLGDLVHLNLGRNHLTGTIPPELGNLYDLDYLDLGGNKLSGTIPSALGNLYGMVQLYLDNNHLSGSIPQSLGYLSEMTVIFLSGNRLTGPIPPSFTNLDSLTWLSDIRYNALYVDNESLRAFLDNRGFNWSDGQTLAPPQLTAAAVSTSSITVSWTPIAYTDETGGYQVYYSTSPGGPYTYAGKTADKSTASYTVTGLIPGTTYYFIVKTQTDPHANNDNTVISDASEEVWAVTHTVLPGQDQPPFGIMELPQGGETPVSGSIAVSGWALDDVEVTNVKIYHLVGDGKTYIGDAVFVEGARPDVEEAYPDYPNNRKAGWGYMLLTNFLPNGGNGTYTLQATAWDYLGHETTLGTKTIVCDNVNAEKPFGAIDTPGQGGIASGSGYINNGWVLTPMPNKIPEDGSTINVYVDGVLMGHPTYNAFRQDIANLFPGYANSDGAWAYFELDTTAYTNGLHQIYWTAADDAGNTEGIGSRYFSVQNSMVNSQWSVVNGQWGMGHGARSVEQGAGGNITVGDFRPVAVKKGYNQYIEPQLVYPDDEGIITIEIHPLERVVIQLGNNKAKYSGYLLVGNQLRPLPIGSTLDTETGIFYWQTGSMFAGLYQLLFIEEVQTNETRVRKIINVVIGQSILNNLTTN